MSPAKMYVLPLKITTENKNKVKENRVVHIMCQLPVNHFILLRAMCCVSFLHPGDILCKCKINNENL